MKILLTIMIILSICEMRNHRPTHKAMRFKKSRSTTRSRSRSRKGIKGTVKTYIQGADPSQRRAQDAIHLKNHYGYPSDASPYANGGRS
jgi:hypothetical protein